MAFFQPPPELGNQFDRDALLGEWLPFALPPEILRAETGHFRHLGELGGQELFQAQLADREQEPRHVPYDPWGHRVDEVTETPLWRRARHLAAEHGLVAAGYAGTYGRFDRVVQFVRNYLVQASLDVYACPLAMTDGAARTLLDADNPGLVDRAVPRLTSTDPERAWTSGQWMTERTGGSDVGRSETEARPTDDPEVYTLHGTKWFTSAVTADMALTLARPVGNPCGGRGLALFYVELRDREGRLQGISVNRLKDKLGTRKVPTAELTLDGCQARLVQGTSGGVKKIASMLNVTRTWNAVSAAFLARRGLALAVDYARRREAFGSRLADKPLHVDTLAGMAAESDAIFHLAFFAVTLMGRAEHGEASAEELSLLRLVTPIAKLTTAKQAVTVSSEALEALGGAGYVEDTGLPVLLRDSQVLPIWEGTTNVLALDALRALSDREAGEATLRTIAQLASEGRSRELEGPAHRALQAAESAATWYARVQEDPEATEAGARRFALTLGRSLALALMVRHAQVTADRGDGRRAIAAARRFAARGIDLVDLELSHQDAVALVGGGAR